MIKCSECSKENISKANYCKYCGKLISEKEKENASKSIAVVWLERLKKVINIITLDFVKGNKVLKIAYVVIVFLVGIYMLCTMGSSLKVVDNEFYDVKYNKSSQEYYLFLEDEESRKVDLQLYVPNKINDLNIGYYDDEGLLLFDEHYSKDDAITLLANKDLDNYYVISDSNNKNNKIKIFVYSKDVMDNE